MPIFRLDLVLALEQICSHRQDGYHPGRKSPRRDESMFDSKPLRRASVSPNRCCVALSLPLVGASSYTALYMNATFVPGMHSAVHRHCATKGRDHEQEIHHRLDRAIRRDGEQDGTHDLGADGPRTGVSVWVRESACVRAEITIN
jgi:hypothetical protein